MKALLVSTLFGVILFAGNVPARTIRATDLSSVVWTQLQRGQLSDLTIEFREHDELPLSFTAEGDLMESKDSVVSFVRIKKNFWLQVTGGKVLMSFDGNTYKPLPEMASGRIEAGAGKDPRGDIANALNVYFLMNSKN